MATKQNIQSWEVHAFQMFAGIGGGSLGAAAARASWMGVSAYIRNIGAIDVDPGACTNRYSSRSCSMPWGRPLYSPPRKPRYGCVEVKTFRSHEDENGIYDNRKSYHLPR